MRCSSGLTSARKFIGIVAVLVCWFPALPAVAQQGQDAVYNNSNGVTNSPTFIDASMFASSPPQRNICAVLNFVLSSTTYPPTGAVIDARGIPGITPPVSMTCTSTDPSRGRESRTHRPRPYCCPPQAAPLPTRSSFLRRGPCRVTRT